MAQSKNLFKVRIQRQATIHAFHFTAQMFHSHAMGEGEVAAHILTGTPVQTSLEQISKYLLC